MSQLTKPLALALALGLAQGAWAQDTTATGDAPAPAATTTTDGAAAPAPAATDAAPAADAAPVADAQAAAPAEAQPAAPAQPEVYAKATYDDWTLQCAKSPDGKDPCQMYQVLKDDKGGSVADITVIDLPEGNPAAAGVTIMVPIQTLLSANLVMQIDNNKPLVYAYSFCDARMMGCFARFGVSPAELDMLKKGNKATISITPLAAPNQKVQASLSLKGFTKAFDETVKTNKANGITQ